MVSGYWYWFFQNFIIKPVWWVFIHLTHRVKISGRENFKNISGPVLIVSNHVVFFDSFFIGLALPLFSSLTPLRYMGEYKKFRHWLLEILRKIGIIHFLYWVMGVFPSHRGEGIEKSIAIPVEILALGGTVVMFPEGMISKIGGLLEFRHGAAAIAIKSGVKLIPIYIKKNGRNIFMKVGESFGFGNSGSVTMEEGTKIIREKIQALSDALSA